MQHRSLSVKPVVADNEVVLVSERGERDVVKAPKERIAAAVLDEVERLLEEKAGVAGGGA